MNTWSFRAALFALFASLLASCDGAENLFEGVLADRKNTALPQATLAFGAVKLIPPEGYCIDAGNLSNDFAIMARCDTLGDQDDEGFAP